MDTSNLFNSTVLVEPTNVCNLKCIMCEAKCTVDTDKSEIEHLMPDKFDIMLSKLDGYINNVVFQGDCEPTMNPHLEELVKIARKYTNQVAIVTNGLALTPKRIDSLVDSGVSWFALSIDDHRAEIYNKIRKYGDFNTVISNLKYLLKVRDERAGYIKVVTHKIVFDNNTIDTLRDYIKFFYLQLGVNKVTFAPIVHEGKINNISWIKMRNEVENSFIDENIDINLSDFANYPYASLYKYCGTNVFFISHLGEFAPCGLHTSSKSTFGNLLTENLDTIVEKDIFKKYHEYWKNKKYGEECPKICKNCYLLKTSYFSYCLDDGYGAMKAFGQDKLKSS